MVTPTDRPTLGLDAHLPRPPDDLRPMLPRTARRLPAGGARLVDPTWGGLRVLAAVRGDRVRLLHDDLDVAEHFPGVMASLAALGLPDAVLDGELIVPGTTGRAMSAAIRRGGTALGPATLVISDLPWLAGRANVTQSLAKRRERLAALAIAGRHLVVVEAATGADAVLQVVKLHGLLGIVAKRADSPYLSGVRSRLWSLVRVADVTAGLERLEPVRSRPDLALLRTLGLGEDDGRPVASTP